MQREYAIDLRRDLRSMSWRRFVTLIRGLSPNSATAAKLRMRQYMGKAPAANVIEVRGEAAERAFATLFGPPAQPRPD